MMHSFIITCLVSVLWLFFGYTIAFGPDGNDFVGGSSKLWLQNAVDIDPTATLPESLFITF